MKRIFSDIRMGGHRTFSVRNKIDLKRKKKLEKTSK